MSICISHKHCLYNTREEIKQVSATADQDEKLKQISASNDILLDILLE